jgi:hypothetical protein
LGYTRIHVVAYAARAEGIQNLISGLPGKPQSRARAFKKKVKVVYHRAISGIAFEGWSEQDAHLLLQINLKYARKFRIPRYARVGFGKSMANIVFSHGCPNNAFGLLWKNGTGYQPLFPGRVIPLELRPAFSGAEATSSLRMLTGASHGSFGDLQHLRGKDAVVMLLILCALRRRIKKRERICSVTGLGPTLVAQTLATAVTHGYVTAEDRISELGRVTLRKLEELHSAPADGYPLRDTLPTLKSFQYFPKSLRAGQSST